MELPAASRKMLKVLGSFDCENIRFAYVLTALRMTV